METTKPRPDHCDGCKRPIMAVFYDASTPHGWGDFCPTCALDLGCKLGTGLGQRYEYNFKDKLYHKTAG